VVVPTKPASDPRFAILLMGYGGGGHDGADLTDSMMVVIVDPQQKTLTLYSIPRDAWVPILFDGQKAVYNKINTAYALAKDPYLYTGRLPRYKGNQGAGLLAMDTVSRLLGIPVPYYLALDFAGFREMINLVGGIDVDIPDGFSAYYPANDNPSIDPSWIVVRFRKGLEHMNGERAIQYARARETIDSISEGSDFARSRRQRLIMEAFKTKLLQPEGLIHLPQLLGVASSHVDTNYDLPSATQLAQLALGWKDVQFYQAALTTGNYLSEATGPEGMYILVPDSADHSWARIRAVSHRIWQDPKLGVAMVNTEIVVQNNTGVAGVATRFSDDLVKLGYRVGPLASGPAQTRTRVVDRTGGTCGALISGLEADLRAHLDQVLSEKATGGITLEIGSDYAGLANPAVVPDPSAPSSSFGVVIPGSWAPPVEASPTVASSPTPEHTPVAEPSATPQKVISGDGAQPTATPRAAATPPPPSSTPRPAPPASPTPHRPNPGTPAEKPRQ
jgi:LCP family protein required for cell wall assembly